MCAQCVAQGAAYVVPGLAALRLWSRRRTRALERQAAEPAPAEAQRALARRTSSSVNGATTSPSTTA